MLKELLRLPSLRQMRLLAGEDGLDRMVTWPYVCQMNSFAEWVQGGELIFFSGIGLKTDENSLQTLVKDGNRKNCAGLVFFVSKYIGAIPDSVLRLADGLGIPLFELPWEIRLVEITKEVSGYLVARQNEYLSLRSFVEDLLSEDGARFEKAAERAEYFGVQPSLRYQAAVIGIGAAAFETGEAREPGPAYPPLAAELRRLRRGAFCVPQGGGTAVLVLPLPAPAAGGEEENRRLLEKLCGALARKFPQAAPRAGLGRAYETFRELRRSLRDAEMSLRAAALTAAGSAVVCYRELGVYRLLFRVEEREELRCFYEDTVGSVAEYDRHNGTELLRTLEAYFENMLNLNRTAQALFLHRNSLIYRMNRIEEILGRPLSDPRTVRELQLSLAVGRFLSL